MTTTDKETVVGIFDHQAQAKLAIAALQRSGFSSGQIGVASKEWTKHFDNVSSDSQQTAERGAAWGSVIGGGVGAVVGLIGATLIPGAIPLLAGQFLMTTLLGGAAGAAGGAFSGPFLALGFSESEASGLDERVKEGKTAVIVYAPNRQTAAREVLVESGAYDDAMSTSP